MAPDTVSHARPYIGFRLLALFYDLWPMVASWMLIAIPFVLIDAAIAGDTRHNIGAYSALWWAQWLACWCATGAYAVLSWSRGGQTLGMRPWRLRVAAIDGAAPSRVALLKRYGVGTASLLLAGAGFWWAWIDRDRLTWHDRASGTRVVRDAKRKKGGVGAV